jgi:uncharacterized protein
MSAGVVRFEIPLDNVERGQEFYRRVFGWQLDAMPEMSYTMVQTADSDEQGMPKSPGTINGGMAPRGPNLPVPTVVISVDDILVTAKSIEKHGGKLTQKKAPIGDGSFGLSAYFTDSEGNVIGLFERPTP